MYSFIRRLSAFAALVVASISLYAQQLKTVRGTVVDESGEPVIGCAVYSPDNVKGGVATDVEGVFLIKLSEKVTSLTFEALGFEKVTLPVDKVRRVRLTPDAMSIDEVVVTGIFTRKKDSFTGAVQTISSEEIKRVSNANVVQALKNLDPSLLILDNLEAGSNPNRMASMQLRGATSLPHEATGLKSNFLNEANTPMFILDGFETSLEKITDMDMNRIQSITILKDASAKAIYGSKGANGVIVVETKALGNQRTLVTYTGNLTLEAPDLTSYNLCNALEKLELERREGLYSVEAAGTVSSMEYVALQRLYNERYKRALEGESTYWLSKPLRMGIGHKHTLEVEIGDKDLKALLTASYNDVQGAMKGSYRDIISAQANVSYRLNKWVFRNIMDVSSMRSSESPWGNFSEYAKMNPYWTPYDEEGNIKKTVWSGIYTTPEGYSTYGNSSDPVGNPMYNASIGVVDSGEYLDFSDNLYVECLLIPSLRIVGRLGVDAKRTGYDKFLPADHTEFLDKTSAEDFIRRGTYDQTSGKSTTLSGDISAQFNRSIGGVHDIFATAQYSISSREYHETSHHAEGFPNSHMTDISFARQYETGTSPTGYSGLFRDIGALLTAGYTYRNRYMADATVRTSGASVFGTDNHWGVFWSFGAAWNIHNEDFMKSASWLRQLKFRASLGSSGNQNYAQNYSLPIYKYYSSSYYNGFPGAILSNMENRELGWEEKMEYNIGIDFRTKRINATIDAYIADTRNLLFPRSLVPSAGFGTVQDNLGTVRNKGIEASLSYTVFQKGSSYVSIFGRVAANDNKVLQISESLEEYNRQQQAYAKANNVETPVIQYYNGVPLHSIWVVPSLGINPYTGAEVFIDKNGNMTDTWNPTDLVNFGSSDPIVTGNFGINGEVSGIGFNVTMRFTAGGYLYNSTLLDKVERANPQYNVDRRAYLGRWSKRGDAVPFMQYQAVSTSHPSSRFVQRNNQLHVSAVSLYYEFPASVTRALRMQRLRVSANTNDLYTFSSIEIERGTSYPYARSFTFSLTATF